MKEKQNVAKKKKSNYLFYDFVKVTAALPGLIWLRPRIYYENKAAKKRIKGGALIISNHLGFLDPIYLQYAIWYRRHNFVCLSEIMKKKGAWFYKGVHCIPVDRDNFTMDTYRRITDAMSDRRLVTMFPEGHINTSEDKNIDSFKPGMIMMALKGGHPIVPVYIKERKKFWNRLRVMIGEPVDIVKMYGNKPTFSQINEMTKVLQDREQHLKEIMTSVS